MREGIEQKMVLREPIAIKNRVSYASTLKIDVVKRLLSALRENGGIKRTNLAGRTGMNYTKCIKYMNLLSLLGWIEVDLGDNYFVKITERGRAVSEILSSVV